MIAKMMLAALLAIPVAARPALAQATALPPDQQQFLGKWEGLFESDHAPPGLITVQISRDSVWHVSLAVHIGDEVFTSVGTDIAVAGSTISWAQETMGQACQGFASLEQGKLLGETSCGGSGLKYALTRSTTGAPTR